MVHNRDSVWIWVGVGLVPEVHDHFGPFSPFLLPLCPGTRVILAWITSSAKKVWATGAGSANPVVSMMTPSSLLPSSVVFFKMLRRPWMRSPLTSCSSPQRGSTKSIEKYRNTTSVLKIFEVCHFAMTNCDKLLCNKCSRCSSRWSVRLRGLLAERSICRQFQFRQIRFRLLQSASRVFPTQTQK